VVPPPHAPAPGINASALRYTPPSPAAVPGGSADTPAETTADEIETILQAAKLDPAEFGTIVHAYLEAPERRGKGLIPPRFLARLSEKEIRAVDTAARDMAEKFLDSDLGRQSMADPDREAEFPILTMVEAGGAAIPVHGVIDLLFESRGTMYVVDFKTDRLEEPERHLGQLAVYGRAVSDIFGKPVRAWVFFLRSGSARELTADLEKVNIEEMCALHGCP
jgi:ATP-dependent helicase/nuclease subunit A